MNKLMLTSYVFTAPHSNSAVLPRFSRASCKYRLGNSDNLRTLSSFFPRSFPINSSPINGLRTLLQKHTRREYSHAGYDAN
jgi:hypothetical protein